MMKRLGFGVTAILLFGLFSRASSDPPKPPPQGQPKPPAASATAGAEQPVSPEEKRKRKEWNDSMLRKPVPKKGCFNAAYPSLEWKEVACVAPPPPNIRFN